MKRWEILLIIVMLLFLTTCANNVQIQSIKENFENSDSEETTVLKTTDSGSELKLIKNSNSKQQTIIETYLKTISDDWYDWFLYDITGDGFPEIISMYIPETTWFFKVYDFSGAEPIEIGSFDGEIGGEIFICQDLQGERFILSYGGAYNMMGVVWYYCEKNMIEEHIIKREVLGETETYYSDWDKNEYYNAYISFDGLIKDGIGFCKKDANGKIDSEKRLIQYMNEYLNNYEILDVITLPEYGQEDVFVADMQQKAERYNYVPDYDYVEWFEEYQNEIKDRTITICGKEYDSQTDTLYLSWNDLDETFDSDILNEFPNLRVIQFNEGYGMESYEKINIKVSDWCENIQVMRIAPQYFELMGDFQRFSNLVEIDLWGDRNEMGDISYILNFSNLKVINLWMDNMTMDVVENVSRMDNVEVVTYSGQRNFYGEMTEEQREQVEETLSNKIFVGVK